MGYRLGNGRGTYVDNEKGLNRLKKYATMYGLTSTSGIELSESEPTFSSEDIVRSSIGQGTNSYTPVQMSRYVTTLANGKNCYDLTLVDRTKDTTTDEVTENSAKVKSELDISSSTLKAVKNGMYRVVNNGDYTSMFQSLPVKVAGKTGTAQITANEPNYAWFVSFAPYDNPEITVTVQIPNGYTSANAADLASKVYKYYFDKKSRKSLLRQKVSASSAGSGSQTD
jgi:penicillin-binding protein 2